MAPKREATDKPTLLEIDRQAALISAFLDEYLDAAQTAADKAKYAMSVSDEQKFKGDYDHWSKIVSACKWLKGKAAAFARRNVQRGNHVNGAEME